MGSWFASANSRSSCSRRSAAAWHSSTLRHLGRSPEAADLVGGGTPLTRASAGSDDDTNRRAAAGNSKVFRRVDENVGFADGFGANDQAQAVDNRAAVQSVLESFILDVYVEQANLFVCLLACLYQGRRRRWFGVAVGSAWVPVVRD